MMTRYFIRVIIAVFLLSSAAPALAQETPSSFRFGRFFKDLEFTTRTRLEYNDNILLTENQKDSDFSPILTQGIKYRKKIQDYFLEVTYLGNYRYYTEEDTGTLGHTAGFLLSYRPYKKFSIGIANQFYWLSDSKITSPIGDRLLALGYKQITPSVEIKYEFTPRLTSVTDLTYRKLDVRDGGEDDFIDYQKTNLTKRFEYALDEENNWITTAGYEFDRITFVQTFEKDAVTHRPFAGLTRKFPGLLKTGAEIGFANINFDDHNVDDDNIDYRIFAETLYSTFTKFSLEYIFNKNNPSLRSDYTQYSANRGVARLRHTINPKLSLNLHYVDDILNFNSSDALIGAAQSDRQTHIHTTGLELNRKLKPWLTLTLDYTFSKRYSDFEGEDYSVNRYGLSLKAEY